MNIRYSDFTDCSIEFESESVDEKELLRNIYLKLIRASLTERTEILGRMLGD